MVTLDEKIGDSIMPSYLCIECAKEAADKIDDYAAENADEALEQWASSDE